MQTSSIKRLLSMRRAAVALASLVIFAASPASFADDDPANLRVLLRGVDKR